MPLAIVFWVLYLLWIVSIAYFASIGGIWAVNVWFLPLLIVACLGWQVFGPAIRKG